MQTVYYNTKPKYSSVLLLSFNKSTYSKFILQQWSMRISRGLSGAEIRYGLQLATKQLQLFIRNI
jgi:hypothetical protein